MKLKVTDEHLYHVVVGREVLRDVEKFLPEEVSAHTAIIGRGVYESASWVKDELAKAFKYVKVLDDGEKAKELEVALKIVEALWEGGADRWSALGVASGGSLGDAAAFAASTYMRGIPLIMFPTTLLAMIDSALGGKTAVNWKGVKNVVGSFYHPWLVVSDLRFLDTLPPRVFKSSLAEAIKYGMTLDRQFLTYLVQNNKRILEREDEALINVIVKSSELKLGVVKEDPKERKGVREVLNFGHTVGHAIESASGFSLLHGEAVALGMRVEALYSERAGFCSSCSDALQRALERFSLIQLKPPKIDIESYRALIMKDKKRAGEYLRLPVLRDVGKWELQKVPIKEFVEETYKIMNEIFWS